MAFIGEDLDEEGSQKYLPQIPLVRINKLGAFNHSDIESSLGEAFENQQGPATGEGGGTGDSSVEGASFPKITKLSHQLQKSYITSLYYSVDTTLNTGTLLFFMSSIAGRKSNQSRAIGQVKAST